MATAKSRSSLPVRGYYVTTINTGRIVQTSSHGFGLPRLGGLLNAQVEGLTGGGSAAGRLAAQAPDRREFEAAKEEEKERVKAHHEWKNRIRETAKVEAEDTKKGEELQKRLADQARKAEDKPKEVVPTIEIVKDPTTGVPRATAKDFAPAEDLNDPKKVANAERKTVEQQKKEAAADQASPTEGAKK